VAKHNAKLAAPIQVKCCLTIKQCNNGRQGPWGAKVACEDQGLNRRAPKYFSFVKSVCGACFLPKTCLRHRVRHSRIMKSTPDFLPERFEVGVHPALLPRQRSKNQQEHGAHHRLKELFSCPKNSRT
jgi:hypothetical protein